MECFPAVILKLMQKKFLPEERLSKTLVYYKKIILLILFQIKKHYQNFMSYYKVPYRLTTINNIPWIKSMKLWKIKDKMAQKEKL